MALSRNDVSGTKVFSCSDHLLILILGIHGTAVLTQFLIITYERKKQWSKPGFLMKKWLSCSNFAVFYELLSSHCVFIACHKTHIEDKVPPARLGLGNTLLGTVGDVAEFHGEM